MWCRCFFTRKGLEALFFGGSFSGVRLLSLPTQRPPTAAACLVERKREEERALSRSA